MSDETTISAPVVCDETLSATFRVYECPDGGFVFADFDAHGNQRMRKAVSNIDEVCGVLANACRQWNTETLRFRAAQVEDERKIIRPNFWQRVLRAASE